MRIVAGFVLGVVAVFAVAGGVIAWGILDFSGPQ